MMRLTPGSSTPEKRPSRSTPHRLCGGAIRTPSMTEATFTPMINPQGQYFDSPGTWDAAIASPIAPASFNGMVEPPSFEWIARPSAGAVLDDFERVAIRGENVHRGPRLERFEPLDAGIPARAAVAH